MITILSSLLSGLVACAVSTWFYTRHESKKEKLTIFHEIMGNRHGLTHEGNSESKARFFQALNSTYAVFHDSKVVVSALNDFKIHKGRDGDNVTQLIRRMAEDLKIDTSYLDDEFFKEPFVPESIN